MINTPLESLPQRIFLDSSTLQYINNYGGFIWENEPMYSDDKIKTIPQGIETIEALRKIFFVNQRAMWEFIISTNSLREVNAKNDIQYLKYSYDVFDYCQICLEESSLPQKIPIDIDNISKILSSNIGEGDLSLLIDAKQLSCDAFLTCDFKLAKSIELILKHLNIYVMSPIIYWKMIEPWARLFV